MPQTTLGSEWLSNGPDLKNYQLKSYHKIKPAERVYYTSMHTNEIFNILPELYQYSHVTYLIIHILNPKQLENMECLGNKLIRPCPNITTIQLTVKVKVPDDIINQLFLVFPNITRLWMSYPKGACISLMGIGPNLQQLRLRAKKISEACIDSICRMNQLNSISIGYENGEKLPQPYIDKLMELVANRNDYNADWLHADDTQFNYNW